MSARSILYAAVIVLALATAGMLARIEPFGSWYYLFAWYATIVIADAWTHQRQRREPLLIVRPAVMISLFAWSAVIWFSFELWNLRLENWYYVNVPDARWLRWAGTILAFATVLPGLFFVTRLLGTFGVGAGVRTRPFRLKPVHLWMLVGLGAISVLLVLVWPRTYFPLVWGIAFFLIAPLNHRFSQRGLLREIAAGKWGLPLRLLLAGAICGFLWELFNISARAKWIYTVPGFEELKLFEMPVLGFLGFPPFALECYEMYRAVVMVGLARDWESGPPADRSPLGSAPTRTHPVAAVLIAPAMIAFCILSLGLMDQRTVDSMIPRPADLTLVAARPELGARIAELGIRDVAKLEKLLEQGDSAERLGVSPEMRARLDAQVELVLLRGIGTANASRLAAVGVNDVAELARTDAAGLEGWMRAADPQFEPRPARLRVWIRAAQERMAASGVR